MAEEIVFKTTVDTGNSVSAINNVDKSLKAVNNTIKEVSSTSKQMSSLEKQMSDINTKVESGTLDVRQLTMVIKEYQTVALNAGANSPIGQEAVKKAGELRDKLGDLNTQINHVANDGKNMQTALQVGQGISAGYAVAQGAMALFGSESKDLQKTLVKLQAAQAVLNGLEQIRIVLNKDSLVMTKARFVWDKIKIASEYAYTTAIGTSTGALKLARLAMLALPIVAIIAGIMAIAGAMGAFGNATEEATEKQKKFDEQQRKSKAFGAKMLQEDYEKTKDAQQKKMDLDKARGMSDDELYKKEQDNLQLRLNMLKFATDKNKEQVAEMRAIKQQILVNEAQHLTDLRDKEEQNAEERAKNKDKRDAKILADAKLQADKRLELARTIEDLMIANIQDSDLRQLEELRVRHERERQELVAKFGNDAVLIKELTEKQSNELSVLNTELLTQRTEKEKEDNTKILELLNKDAKATLEAKLINIREDFELEQELKKELADLELEQALQQEGLTNGEIEKLKAEHQAKLDAIKKDGIDKEKALNEEAVKQGYDITEKSLQSIQNLSDIYFSSKMGKLEKGSAEEEKYARKQFELNKAMQIAGAVVDGAKAVTASLASSPVAIGPVPNPVGIASLALAVSSSVASIAKIASTKFGGTGGGGVTAPKVPTNNGGGTDANATQANNMGNTSQVSSVGLIDNSTGIKVTVVDSEIKAVMDASAQANVVSTLGG